jgi:hypothetical protein
MMRKLLLLLAVVALTACNSDKKKVEAFIDNNFFDREVTVTGDVTIDSAYCPMSQLEQNSIQLMGHRGNLLKLLDENPDSAYALAKALKVQLGDNKAFANLAYPNGKNNRLAYMAKCAVDGKERMVIFYKQVEGDKIELSSFDVDEAIDSLMVGYNHLMDGIRVILADKNEE